jgi:DNA repair protein RadA/Sms
VSKELEMTVIFVAHATKVGEIAGLNEIGHMVDAVAEFSGNPQTEPRTLHFRKNRKGKTAARKAYLRFTDRGMVEADPPPPTNDGAAGRYPRYPRGDGGGAGSAAA